jgi:hypothetical protein
MGTTGIDNGLGPLNTTSFLFDDNEDKHLSLNAIDLTSPVAKAYAQLGGDNTFPILRGDSLSGKVRLTSLTLYPDTTDFLIALCQLGSTRPGELKGSWLRPMVSRSSPSTISPEHASYRLQHVSPCLEQSE